MVRFSRKVVRDKTYINQYVEERLTTLTSLTTVFWTTGYGEEKIIKCRGSVG
jgi:hypothetical protein